MENHHTSLSRHGEIDMNIHKPLIELRIISYYREQILPVNNFLSPVSIFRREATFAHNFVRPSVVKSYPSSQLLKP